MLISYVLLQINSPNNVVKDKRHTNSHSQFNQWIKLSVLGTKNFLGGLPELPIQKRQWNSRVCTLPLYLPYGRERITSGVILQKTPGVFLNRVWTEIPNCYEFQTICGTVRYNRSSKGVIYESYVTDSGE
jgi:hypothetical protein